MRVYVLMRVSCHMLCVFVLKNTPQQTTMLILLSRQISKGLTLQDESINICAVCLKSILHHLSIYCYCLLFQVVLL